MHPSACGRTAASWVKKSMRGKKLQFSDRQLQISHGGHYRCSVSILPQNSSKMRYFWPQILYFGTRIFLEEQFFNRLKFRGDCPCPPHCYVAPSGRTKVKGVRGEELLRRVNMTQQQHLLPILGVASRYGSNSRDLYCTATAGSVRQ